MKVYIFFLMLVMGILPSFIMRVGILQSYEERAVNLRISDTQTQFKIIANHLLNNNYLQDTSNEAINAELEPVSYTHLDVYKRQIIDNVRQVGAYLEEKLAALVDNYDFIEAHRGVGLMLSLIHI